MRRRAARTGSGPFSEIRRAVFISAALATREPLQSGDPFTLVINDKMVTLEVAGIIPSTVETPRAPATLLVMDLPAVEELTGQSGGSAASNSSLKRVRTLKRDAPPSRSSWSIGARDDGRSLRRRNGGKAPPR
jgi:hypothetical protein